MKQMIDLVWPNNTFAYNRPLQQPLTMASNRKKASFVACGRIPIVNPASFFPGGGGGGGMDTLKVAV